MMVRTPRTMRSRSAVCRASEAALPVGGVSTGTWRWPIGTAGLVPVAAERASSAVR